jgi:hypothetical protein
MRLGKQRAPGQIRPSAIRHLAALEEGGKRDPDRVSDQRQPACANAVISVLILLDLLERDPNPPP